jgi:hypothetical protein
MSRAKILEHNKQLQLGNAPVRRLDEGYVALKIPLEDWKVLQRLFPELQSKDKDIRLKAWKTLEASELGEKYRVTPRRKGTNNHRIIVR